MRPTLAAFLACLAGTVPCHAAEAVRLPLQAHSVFFSMETKQARQIDPQVFVADAGATAGVGPQGIHHAAGVRPALTKADPPSAPLLNADGMPLGFSLGEWLAAEGEVTVTPAGAGVRLAMTFTGLRPNAQYSLFENHFDQTPIGFTPLDGAGTANGFKTDARGNATASVVAPAPLTHDNAVAVLLDDDGKTYGAQRGPVGVGVQTHLIGRPAH